jgi:hypothetical protein
MITRALSTLLAASLIAFCGAAQAHDATELPEMNAISFDPNLCIVYFPGIPGAVQGTSGRVMVKFDWTHTLTVQANCTVTAFEDEFQGALNEEGFDCFVQLTKSGNHWHQIIYGDDLGVLNKLRFKNGKATMSCSGPYDETQN